MLFLFRIFNYGSCGETTPPGADLYGLRGGGTLKNLLRQNSTAQALRRARYNLPHCGI